MEMEVKIVKLFSNSDYQRKDHACVPCSLWFVKEEEKKINRNFLNKMSSEKKRKTLEFESKANEVHNFYIALTSVG